MPVVVRWLEDTRQDEPNRCQVVPVGPLNETPKLSLKSSYLHTLWFYGSSDPLFIPTSCLPVRKDSTASPCWYSEARRHSLLPQLHSSPPHPPPHLPLPGDCRSSTASLQSAPLGCTRNLFSILLAGITILCTIKQQLSRKLS